MVGVGVGGVVWYVHLFEYQGQYEARQLNRNSRFFPADIFQNIDVIFIEYSDSEPYMPGMTFSR